MQPDYSSFLIGALSGIFTGLAVLLGYRASGFQNHLSATGIASDWLRELRAWAGETIDVLSEAAALSNQHPDKCSEGLARCQIKLIALTDRGRFLLPNEKEDHHGDHKASAYRGFRHPALDALVAATKVINGQISLYGFPNESTALSHIQREFVSIVHEILAPRSTNRAVAAILRHAHHERANDPTLGGLLPDPQKIPLGDEQLLWTAFRRYKELLMHSCSNQVRVDLTAKGRLRSRRSDKS